MNINFSKCQMHIHNSKYYAKTNVLHVQHKNEKHVLPLFCTEEGFLLQFRNNNLLLTYPLVHIYVFFYI